MVLSLLVNNGFMVEENSPMAEKLGLLDDKNGHIFILELAEVVLVVFVNFPVNTVIILFTQCFLRQFICQVEFPFIFHLRSSQYCYVPSDKC